MKRLFGLIFGFVIFSVFIGCSTTERLAMSSLYSISNDSKEDIRGTLNVSRLLIFKGIAMFSNEVVTIDKFTQNEQSLFSVTVQYLGPDWRFLQEIILKIDDDLITLKDDKPSRTVNRTANVTVTEIVACIMNQTVIEKLKNCNSLIIQYYKKPITIPPEGIDAIKGFLQ